MLRVMLSPVSTMLGAVITTVMMVYALSLGSSSAIAAYSVGVSVGAIVAVIVGGGTTFAFITGDIDIRRAARVLRVKVVVPTVLFATLAAAVIYSTLTPLSLSAILLGGVAALSNVVSELEVAYLNRKLRTVTVLFVDLSSRLLGAVALLLFESFPIAMALAGVVRLALYSFTSRADESRVGLWRGAIRSSWKLASRPALIGMALCYAFLDRFLFLIVPLGTSAVVAGYFAAMLSAQQAIGGALAAGLQTLMGARAGSTEAAGEAIHAWGRRAERLIVLAALLIAALGVVLAPIALGVLHAPDTEPIPAMWVVIMCALPLAVLSRAIQYRLVTESKAPQSLFMLVSAVAVQVCVALAGLVTGELLVTISALIAGEIAGILWISLSSFKRRLTETS
jgi:hypothetical protein